MISDAIAELRLRDSPTIEHIDFAALDGYRFADGEGFPASYRAFVRHAGWGRTFGLWLVYPPVRLGYADGLRGRGAQLTRRFRASCRDGESEAFDWMVEPDGNWSLAATLDVFAWSENGDALLWNSASRNADGEFPIWESRGLDSLHYLGADLRAALPLVRDRSIGSFGPRPFDVEPLPATRL
ncbi:MULTISPECIES: hypothetical protein [Streptomyces]|uniref:hypothetical protein n=1 Tax=Streptomyces TaxID=1883 RepID=UPI0006AD14BF|nr:MULTISPECIES: hypothetical protein [Streptomyces]ALC26183.1 hypothetical protein ABE83_03095 [Streptomyces sp. CFMR 7]MBT3073264.1 hypothetical protein [Streptomyces sp. COG21]MBT3081664.1 hypothetical protein [Streptomyces sp. COG20]MBT3085162.1 hypothetical protein [Streptomyces sp. CYG21]MBT3100415.1 hypothetical protein [Streptomyces sp. CBG30]